MGDPRRRIPRTDVLLADPRLVAAAERLGASAVKEAARAAQDAARAGTVAPEQVADHAVALLPRGPASLRPVLNATGVVVHTNIGRAPLSPAAVLAVVEASGYADVELDLETGARARRRGAGALAALLGAVPEAEAALVVNNGAAALVLATTALAAGREVVVSRGEMVEIGDGFRLPELIASTGARLREIGTTNRTHRADYEQALSPEAGCILKVHPSNFKVEGFTSAVPISALAGLADASGREIPVVADIGSGLLAPDPSLPQEPDARTGLREGAAVVTCSGDKLLGGPQAGIVLGRADVVERLRRHPLARALRVDKTTLAALEATLRGPVPPVTRYRSARPADLRARAEEIAAAVTAAVGSGTGVEVVETDGRIGGGGAPGHPLPGWAVALRCRDIEGLARALRTAEPAVLPRIDEGALLVDLRCVEPVDDERLRGALLAALQAFDGRAVGGGGVASPWEGPAGAGSEGTP